MTQRTINLPLNCEQVEWLIEVLPEIDFSVLQQHPRCTSLDDDQTVEWFLENLEALRYQLEYLEVENAG